MRVKGETMKKLLELLKRFYDWKYYNKTIKLVSTLCAFAGLFGFGSSVIRNYQIQKRDTVQGNGNVSGSHNAIGRGNAVGNHNVVGDGNTVTYGEVFDYDRLERIMQTQFKYVEKLVDLKIANAQDVKVVNKQPLLVRNPAGLDLLARKAREALLKRDYTNAVEFANEAYKMIEEHLAVAKGREQFDVEGAFIGNMERVIPILMEEALASEKFDRMYELAAQFNHLFGEFNPYSQAMLTIAGVRREQRRLVFFSPERIRELKKLEKEKLTVYLHILASYGYIQPIALDLEKKSIRRTEYGRFFGLGHALPYQMAFRVRVEGKGLNSNEIAGQWCGLGKSELIDINHDAHLAMGLTEDERMKLPIQLHGEFTGGARTAPFRGHIIETKFKWKNSIPLLKQTNVYSVIFTDWDGEERVAGETSDTSFDTAESRRNKVPEPSTGLLLLVGVAFVALRRRV